MGTILEGHAQNDGCYACMLDTTELKTPDEALVHGYMLATLPIWKHVRTPDEAMHLIMRGACIRHKGMIAKDMAAFEKALEDGPPVPLPEVDREGW